MERVGVKILQHKGCDSSPRSVPEDRTGFLLHLLYSFPHHLMSSLTSLLTHIHTSSSVHTFFPLEETQAFTYRSLSTSHGSSPSSSSHAQVPVLSSVCLLYSLHNARINFSKPIWAVARFGKERRAELLCSGKFPLHTSLEVDRFLLYAARFNLHTEQKERGDRGRTRRGEGSQHTAGNH